MATEALGAASEAAKLALKLGMAAFDVAAAVADVGEGLPWVGGVLVAVRSVRDKVETATSNREDLQSLQERCTYLTACVIVNARRASSEIDVSPLMECLRDVERLVDRCRKRGSFFRVLHSTDDKGQIGQMHERIGRLTSDLGLSGIVTVDGKVDNLHMLLNEIKTDMHRPTPKRAVLPRGVPVRQSWHVRRERVMQDVVEGLRGSAEPCVVGLVGDSGSGKTTAASEVVRSAEVLEMFPDGIVWLPVNKGAADRLQSLLWQVATIVHEDLFGSNGKAPSGSGDGAAHYVHKRVDKGNGGRGLRCLIVADDVWEPQVLLSLREMGMWLLVTARTEELFEDVQGEVVGIDTLSNDDALSVLRRASELSEGNILPDVARELSELCGRIAMNIAFVGRWSTVRKRDDPSAWSRATAAVKTELRALKSEATGANGKPSLADRRMAVLRAGFRYLGAENDHVQWLYVALAVMPDGYAFTVREVAVLLYGLGPNVEDVQATEDVLDILERWSIVSAVGKRINSKNFTYCMHDAHLAFARESLGDRGDIRRLAVERWAGHLSSQDVLVRVGRFALAGLWRALDVVGGDNCRSSRPYEDLLLEFEDKSLPSFRKLLLRVTGLCDAQGDAEGAYNLRQRLLLVEQKVLGADHAFVLSTIRFLAESAEGLRRMDEAREWRQKLKEALDTAISSQDGVVGTRDIDAESVRSLAATMMESGRQVEAESLFRRSLDTLEAMEDPDALAVASALHSLGVCVRRRGRFGEAEQLLKRCLDLKLQNLGANNLAVAFTLHNLGMCIRQQGRQEEAVESLERALVIFEVKVGPDDLKVANIAHQLGLCAKGGGNFAEAVKYFTRAVEIFEAQFRPKDWRVVRSQRELRRCVRRVEETSNG